VLVDLESEWFKLYCKAVLESEPDTARLFVKSAIESIDERLQIPEVSQEEREAMLAAIRYLTLLNECELPKAS
jgi:hypothetical protein